MALGACDEAAPSQGATQQTRRPQFQRTELVPGQTSLRAQLTTHARQAYADGLLPVAYAHAEWCGPCQAIARHADDPAMREAFTGVAVAGIDVDRWGRVEVRALEMGAVLPSWYALGEDGEATGAAVDGGAWAEDVPANMAPVLSAFFSEARARR